MLRDTHRFEAGVQNPNFRELTVANLRCIRPVSDFVINGLVRAIEILTERNKIPGSFSIVRWGNIGTALGFRV